METDERFMRIALSEAAKGRGAVEPNPMVGAVLVRRGRELGRGHHRAFGMPHAEVEAINTALAAGHSPKDATLYVTLEPCCHFGKTPPCTDAIKSAGIARVVAAMTDPDPRVGGRGLEQLAQAGIKVSTGVLEDQARRLLGAYIKLRVHARPWVICKWAQTANGLLALPPGMGRWISCEQARNYSHRLRGLCDGVCVGIGTVQADDPELTNRSGVGSQPRRVVLDGNLRIHRNSLLVRTAPRHGLIVATTDTAVDLHPDRYDWLRQAPGVEVMVLPEHGRQLSGRAFRSVDLGSLLDELGQLQWTHLLVEGGARVHRSIISQGLADELLVFVAQASPEGPPELPRLDINEMASQMHLTPDERQTVGDDQMLRYVLRRE